MTREKAGHAESLPFSFSHQKSLFCPLRQLSPDFPQAYPYDKSIKDFPS
jgi:hypothetical protein